MCAVKVIETRAIISASDETGATFAHIAAKLENMEHTAKRAGESTARIGQSFKGLTSNAAAAAAAIGSIGAAAVLAASAGISKIEQLTKSILDLGEQYDKITRRQRAVLNISPAQQEPLIRQAKSLGASTPFSDIQVLEAQTALAQRGIATEFVEPIVNAASVLAQALGIGLVEAAQKAESAFFASGQQAKDAATAQKDFNALISSMVKTSQLSGMNADELSQFYKFGLPTAHAAGVSLPFFESIGAALHRAGLAGEEAGVASRAFVGSMLHPTAGARNVFDALGVRYSDFAKAGPMSGENLSATMQRRLGRTLTPAELAAVNAVIADPEVAGEQGAFTSATAKALGGENLKPNDAKKLAKVIGDFWTSSLANIDVEGLLKAVLAARPTAAQDVAMMGGRQGGRFALLVEHAEDLRNFEAKIRAAPADLARRQADIQMGGFAGAMARLRGGEKVMETNIFQANEGWITELANAGVAAEKAFIEAGAPAAKFATAIGAAIGALSVFEAGLLAMRVANNLAGGGTWLGAAAAGAGWLRSGAMRLGALGAAGYGLYETVKPMPANAGEDERARQLKHGQGWLSNAPPAAGGFTPSPGGLGNYTELRGSATVTNSLSISLDPGLIAKQVHSALAADGNLRGDTGVSMSPSSMLPR
ncbi:MAG: phage tail tape measure protein [Methylocella sp.]